MSPKPQQSCPLSKITQSLTTIHLFVKCASTEMKQFYTCCLIVCLWCSTLRSVLDLPVESEPGQADAEEDQLGSGWEETAGSAAEGLQRKTAQNNNITVCDYVFIFKYLT